MDKDIILQELYTHRDKIRNFGVKELELFGSFAVDKQNKESDIDFLVEFFEGRGGIDDYLTLLHFLEDLFERKIDLVKKDLIRDELKDEILNGVRHVAKV